VTCQLLDGRNAIQNTEMQVGSPEKKSGKLIWPSYKLNWQIKLAQGVANNFGLTPPKVENYHGPRHSTRKRRFSRLAGNPIVVMQDGKIVWLKPEEIQA